MWLNLKKQVIQDIPGVWYSLDKDEYLTHPYEHETYKDPQRRVCTQNQEKLYLFYLLNDIVVTAPTYRTTNIEEVPIEELHRLSTFTLAGLFVKARVLRVIDTTHLELAFFLPFDFVSAYRPAVAQKSISRRAIPYFGDSGFFLRERCCLKGIENPTAGEKGQLALEQLTTFCNGLRNIVYALFYPEGNSRDRPVVLYVDQTREHSINKMILTYDHPEYGKLSKEVLKGQKGPPDSFLVEESYDYDMFF